MNISSIGGETIELLYAHGLVKNVVDLYRLRKEDILQLERMGEKSADNIIKALAASTEVPFSRVLFALGIRFVGAEAAKKLALAFQNIETLASAGLEDLLAVDDVGERIAASLKAYFSKSENMAMIKDLSNFGLRFEVEKEEQVLENASLDGLTLLLVYFRAAFA